MILKNYDNFFKSYGVKFWVLDDIHYPFLLGGTKARKLKYIAEDAQEKGANAIVSAGSASSNHARDCALLCAQLGWKCKLIIHDIEDFSINNLFLMRVSGAELVFCEMKDVASLMDKSMADLKSQGFNPYYIWGGGHSVFGTKALMDAGIEFISEKKNINPDYVIVASGTGGTQAGLHIAFNLLLPQTKVIGISVARDKTRGTEAVNTAILELLNYCGLKKRFLKPPIFLDNWVGDGYGKIYPELIDTVLKAASTGLLTDTTYTGKALCATRQMVESGEIKRGETILFWHTGGVFNLLDHKNFIGDL